MVVEERVQDLFDILRSARTSETEVGKLKLLFCTTHNARTSLITDTTHSLLSRSLRFPNLPRFLTYRLVTSHTTQISVLSACIVLLLHPVLRTSASCLHMYFQSLNSTPSQWRLYLLVGFSTSAR